jgi:hypothetical protein
MRITKEDLNRRWLFATILGAAVFAVVAVMDLQLKARSGFGTADLQGFSRAGQYSSAAFIWSRSSYGIRAGFALGLDYLLMPLYALSFFLSGILAREAFAPRPGRLRRILTLLAAVPIAGALLDALENALELSLLVGHPSDAAAVLSHAVSSAKWVAIYIGVLLLAAAVVARVAERQQKRLSRDPDKDR